jgi:hypothetical protein
MRPLTAGLVRTGIAALAVAAATGCASPARMYVNPQADMTLYEKIVVVPFANLSSDPYAGARVTRAFTTELVIADRFQFVDPATFMGELDKGGARPDAQGQFDPARLRDVAQKLQATAWIRGAVNEYGIVRTQTQEYPVVSFDVEMVDVATGNTVWRVSVTRSGKSRVPVVGGSGERTFGRVTQEACQEAVDQLKKRAL